MAPNVGPFELLFLMAVPALFIALVIWPTWRICSRAGFPGALGLLIVIPVANLFLLFFLAFAEWPALRHNKGYSRLDM